ncbi:MAG: hypothetical protein LIP09_14550 [Bacteroidales bacterium]|nr:hypothetical protein [Bacteroidales bacterium]
MKKYLICLALLATLACGSDGGSKRVSPNEPLAREEGAKAAERAIRTAPGMEREKAILSIRAKEQEIRATGDSLAADAFAKAAQERLDSAGLLR